MNNDFKINAYFSEDCEELERLLEIYLIDFLNKKI